MSPARTQDTYQRGHGLQRGGYPALPVARTGHCRNARPLRDPHADPCLDLHRLRSTVLSPGGGCLEKSTFGCGESCSLAEASTSWLSSQSTGPSIAVGVYYLILPVLVILGILLLALLVVHVLVPLGKRLGIAFNDAGRRHLKKAKAMRSLREAVDQMLGEAFPNMSDIPAVAPTSKAPVTFSWVDLERSGALHFHSEAQVQQAAEDLDAFLCRAVAASRELLVRACAARAARAARGPQEAEVQVQQVHEELSQARPTRTQRVTYLSAIFRDVPLVAGRSAAFSDD